MNDVVERVSRPDPDRPLSEADKSRIFIRFLMLDMIGVAPLLVFLVGFFVLDWFPGKPTWILVAGLLAFVAYQLFAMRASGFWAMIRNASKTNAGR